MTEEAEGNEVLAKIVGKTVVAATSDLTRFAVCLEGGEGLLVLAAGDAEQPTVSVAVVPASDLPALKEAVCTVDWSWITGSTIASAGVSAGRLLLLLDPAGPLNVTALLWKGSPFLSFQPFRPKRGAS